MIFTSPVLTITTAATYTKLRRDRCHTDVISVFDILRLQVLVGNALF